MGGLDAPLYCCSDEMIDDLTNGTIVVAYNVLGTYPEARAESQNILKTVLVSDFPTTMMRIEFVSKKTDKPAAAQRFIQFLVTYRSSPTDDACALPPIHDRENGTEHATIALEPALITFLETLKRTKFRSEWEDALVQNLSLYTYCDVLVFGHR